jgi:hypothetical protein
MTGLDRSEVGASSVGLAQGEVVFVWHGDVMPDDIEVRQNAVARARLSSRRLSWRGFYWSRSISRE